MKIPDSFKYNLFGIVALVAYGILAYATDGFDQEELDFIQLLIGVIVSGQLTIDGIKVVGKKIINKGNEYVNDQPEPTFPPLEPPRP